MQEEKVDVDKMFGGDDETVIARIQELAETVAVEMDATEQLNKDLIKRKAALDEQKAKLCVMLQEAGMVSCKLENGLNPKAKVVQEFYKAKEVEDSTLHLWLKTKDLQDIIKPYVHWQTLNATLRTFLDSGGTLDKSIINQVPRQTITMYGKSKFLTERAGV